MKLTNIALLSAALFSLTVVANGCANKSDDNDDGDTSTDLGTSEAQLVADDSEAAEADEDLEEGVDQPLSGASETDPENPADGASDDEVLEKVRVNAGRFFRPAGCLVSTRDGNKIQHEFKGCAGFWGLGKKFEGTVTSTYVREGNTLTVTHTASGFKANGASINGSRVVVYTREGKIITKHRTGNWQGTTKNGKDISHTADFTASYNDETKCITREGHAETTIGGRSFTRTVTGYERCGIGQGGCPNAGGKIVLTKTKSDETVTVTLDFLGENKFQITKPNGKVVTRTLVCNKNAS